MKNMLYIVSCLLCFILSACANITTRNSITSARSQQEQQALTPYLALQKLKRGNERFLTDRQLERDLRAQKASADKQYPFAILLGCMDSRGSPEIIFDQGIGDIFTQRIAGNIVNKDILGGLEYGTKVIGAQLIVVLGHTSCGAVVGACDHTKLGNLTSLLEKITPAVERTHQSYPSMTCKDSEYINKIAEQNVHNMINIIKKQSPIIAGLIKSGKLGIVGAMHEIATGKITFLEDQHLIPGMPNH